MTLKRKFMAMALVARRRQPTLFIVHTRELAQQGLVRAISLNSSPEEVALAARQQIEEPIVPPAQLVLPTWDDCASQLQTVYNASIRREQCAS